MSAIINFGSTTNKEIVYIKYGTYRKIDLIYNSYDYIIQFIKPPKGGK